MSERWFDHDLYHGLCDTPETLRILHVCKGFPPDRGGMETYVRDLAVEQAHAGHQVTVLAHSRHTSSHEPFEPGGELVRCKTWFHAGGYVPVAPALPLALWRHLRSTQPHILHLHAPNPAALWCLAALPRLASSKQPRPKLVVHWHADVIFPEGKQPSLLCLQLWRSMERHLLKQADRVIVTSRPYLESSAFLAPWHDKCVVAPLQLSERTRVVPTTHPHPVVDFLRGPVGDTKRSVLAVGRLAHYKGFDVLIRAVAQTPEVRCCIIGEGEEETTLHALVNELHLEQRVLLPGAVSDEVLAACYEACDVFCLPSLMRTEAFGVVLLEALRAGKWCVVSNVPGSGMSTLIKHGENGWLVEPGDVDELRRKLAVPSLGALLDTG